MNKKEGNNILFLISNIKIGGGAERVTTKIASAFSHDSDFRTQLLTFYDFYEKTYDCDAEYFSLKETPRKTVLGKAWKALTKRLWGVYKHCTQHDIDSVIAFLPEASVYAILASFLPGNTAKVIVSVRVNPLHKNKLYQAFYSYLYPFADKVVAVSRGVQKILEEDYGLSNVTTIYNPVDVEKMRAEAKKPIPSEHQHIFGGGGLVFVNVGRMSKQKGQWSLIRVFSEIKKENPKSKLVILGDGDLRGKLEGLAKKCGVSDSVYMPGKVDNVFPYLKASDCFVFPSLWEGLPNALLEALAVGTYPITADCKTGPREILAYNKNLDAKIDFPYRTENGTLVSKTESEQVYENTHTVKLNQSEEMLYKEMQKTIDSDAVSVDIPKKRRFEMSNLINQWKEAIL